MFHDIAEPILDRMHHLEQIDARDRADGTSRAKRLRQIPPEAGEFIALLAATAPRGDYVEIGTSAGYSTLWLSLACHAVGATIKTFEIDAKKAELAQETFRVAEVQHLVELVVGDALEHLPGSGDISFCFLDAEKEIYTACYEAVIPSMVSGGILLADNAINHAESLRPMLERAVSDERVDAIVAPIGKGVLVCRKL